MTLTKVVMHTCAHAVLMQFDSGQLHKLAPAAFREAQAEAQAARQVLQGLTLQAPCVRAQLRDEDLPAQEERFRAVQESLYSMWGW